MKHVQALTSAVLPLLVCSLAALLLVTTPAAAAVDEVADLGLSAEDELQLNELAAMFGNEGAQANMMSLMVRGFPNADLRESFSGALAKINAAIEVCGIDTDFTAPPPPTGDELFDAYAQAIDQEFDAMSFEQGIEVTQYGRVPDEVLAEWEPRFGDDPRYWELRYLLKLLRPGAAIDTGQLENENRTDQALDEVEGGTIVTAPPIQAADFLREAERRGCASANTLLLLYDEVRQENSARLEEFSDYEGAPSYWSVALQHLPLRPEFSDEVLAQAAIVRRENEAREEKLLEAACFRGYDQAWPYYMRGLRRLSLGEYESGLRDMQKGNAAPINSYPAPFPIQFVEDSLLTSEPVGGPIVCGSIQIMLISYRMPRYITLKDDCRAAIQMAELGAGVEIYDVWHHFACRLASSSNSKMINSLVSIVLITVLRAAVLENHEGELSAEQVETLNRIFGAREEIKLGTRGIAGGFDAISTGIPAGLAGGARGLPLVFYLQTSLETRTNCNRIFPVFADLAEVSYPGLRTPESMLKYEALPKEVYLARRKCQRAAAGANEMFSAAHEQWDGSED